jgi:Fe-S cluster assembly protein SufB
VLAHRLPISEDLRILLMEEKMAKKPKIAEVDRSLYDFKDDESDFYRIKAGLTEEIVDQISDEKHDPEWMRADFRLEVAEAIQQPGRVPDWGPPIDGLDIGQHR